MTKQEKEEFMYNAFFRKEKPSLLRLACLQLMREGIELDPNNFAEVMSLILDRAETIRKKLRYSKNLRQMHDTIGK